MSENAQAVQARTVSDHEFAKNSVRSLIIKYGGLSLIGMLAQAIMVIFEGIILGNGTGADGLACVGLIMPLENLQIAIGTGFGIGLSTVAALRMGEGDQEGARKAFGTGTFFIAAFMFLVGLFLIAFAPMVARLLGTPDEYMDTIVTMIRIFGVGYPFCGYGQTIVMFFRLDERPGIATWAMTLTAILGVAWLYFCCFIVPIGIVGAGWYYAFSIGGWSFFGIHFFLSKNTKFKYKASDLHIDWGVVGQSIKIALPYFCIQASVSVFTIIVNRIMVSIGYEMGLSVYAILSAYIIYILTMFTTALSSGTTPIISYNLGEKLYDRLRSLLNQSIVINALMVAVVVVLFELFTLPVCELFCGRGALAEACVPAIKVAIAAAFLGSCVSILSSYYQACERIIPAIVSGIARMLIFTVLCMVVMIYVFHMGPDGIWLSLLVADILTFLFTIILTVLENKRVRALEENAK